MNTRRIIYSRHLPFKGYTAMSLLWWIIVRKDRRDRFGAQAYTHELIHWEQQKELLVVGFYILYLLFFFVALFATMGMDWENFHAYFQWKEAYKANPFEQEAYIHEWNTSYLQTRKKYEWLRMLFRQITGKQQ